MSSAASVPTQTAEGQSSAPLLPNNSRWLTYIKAKEITAPVARQLLSVITRVKIVILVDDSSSMNEVINEPSPSGQTVNRFAQARTQPERGMLLWDTMSAPEVSF